MDGYSWHWWRSRNPIFPVGLELLEGKMFGNVLLRSTRLGINRDPDQHPLAKPWGPPGWVQPLLREGQSPRRVPPASTGGEEVFSPSIPPQGFLPWSSPSRRSLPEHPGQSIPAKPPGRGAEPPWDRRETKGCDKAGREPEEGAGLRHFCGSFVQKNQSFLFHPLTTTLLELAEAEGRLGVTTNPRINPLGERRQNF